MRDLSFVAKYDGTEQHYVQIEPPGFEPSARCHLMVALHGHGSDRWQYARDPRDECAGARDVARENARAPPTYDRRASRAACTRERATRRSSRGGCVAPPSFRRPLRGTPERPPNPVAGGARKRAAR